ncbi:MAG: hypothetical protein HC846_13010 [Blastocatellia bacterium]|nr:hypothetical protein [Blastocatellia bacterium]
MGNNGTVCSRIGNDELGKEIFEELTAKNLSTDSIQIDEKYQTGIVNVKLENGQPDYQLS